MGNSSLRTPVSNDSKRLTRRGFIRSASAGIASLGLASAGHAAESPTSTHPTPNKLPKWKGFNFLDFFTPLPDEGRYHTPEEQFQWMADWGFDFVRVPMAYPRFLDIDYEKPITPDEVYKIDEAKVSQVDALVEAAHRYGHHVSLNLHRAPGYCINAGFHEPYNLWLDDEAQEAFYHHWEFWAKRYSGFNRNQISFDLVNEPSMREDMNDQHSKSGPVPGATYRKVAKNALQRIRSANPNHLVIADGNQVGSKVIPEIADLDIAQSCRGYFPGKISHYKAPWAFKDIDSLPEPKWPGQVGNEYLSRAMLETFYQPWIDLKNQGVGVHCGECGCYNQTPHAVFLAWFSDVMDILGTNGIGFGLWNLKGSFGILDSGRSDVAYEDWHGHQLDRKLLNLLQRV